jgi:hypothetical protein
LQTSSIRKLCEVPGAVLAAPTPPSAGHRPTLHDEEPVKLAELGRQADTQIATLEIDEAKHFPALRRQIRKYLADSPTGRQIDELMDSLLIEVESTTIA